MIKNYFKIALRNLASNKTFSLIKIAGLVLALSTSIAIFSWVKHELSYDTFHKDSHRIYRLLPNDGIVSSPPGFKELLSNIPEIDYTVRLFKSGFLGERTKVSRGDIIHTNDEIYYTDEDFFNIFAFNIINGNPKDMLEKPNATVITEATASKYFGDEDPIGQTLRLGDNKEIEITGVIKNIPENAHFHFDILITMKSFPGQINPSGFGSSWIFPTYIKLKNQTSIETVQQKTILAFEAREENFELQISFQPLTDIHLYSSFYSELEPNGDIKYVYLFSAIGILIIIIACINYINLSIALSTNRTKEIGIRKVIGADKNQLHLQIISESLVISIIALILALFLLEILKPVFSSLMGIHFFPNIHSDPYILGFAFLFTIIIGALTGISPAIVLSKLSIIDSIKTRVFSSGKTSKIRSTLVIYQLSVSIILIIGTLVIFQQLRYMQNKKLGYDKEHVLVLHTGFDAITQKMDVFKGLIARNLNVLNMSQSSQLPTNIITGEGINTKDGTRYESSYISVDKNFFDTMGLKVIRGKNHIAAMVAEKNPDQQTFQNLFVVNQSLLREIDVKLTEIDEHTLIIRHGNMKPGSIIGVVEDFHFTSLHTPIGPLVFEFTPDRIEYLLIKIKSDNIPGTINYIEQQWNKLAEGLPFEFHFLDEHYDALYQAEQQLSYLSIIFTLISIVIIVLGLLGLISFITTRKTKEIGIRKVMGASVENILLLLSKTFILWTIVANLIAWPFAWYTMNHWLQNFVYRIEMSWWMFALAGGIALFMTLLTVSFQTIKAAIANPIESLRYE